MYSIMNNILYLTLCDGPAGSAYCCGPKLHRNYDFSESFQHQHWIMRFQKPSMSVKWPKIVVEQDNWLSAISSEWRCPPSWWPAKEPLRGCHISLPPQQNEAHMQQKYVCIYASNWGVEPKLTHPKGSIGILLWTILQWYNDSLLMSNQAGFNGLV